MTVTYPMDLKAICDALAARFTAATMGTPTSSPAMLATYGQQPKSGSQALPATIVEADIAGQVITDNDAWRYRIHVPTVTLFSKRPGDSAQVEAWRQRYLGYLLAAAEGQMKLGIGAQPGYEVKSAMPMDFEWLEYPIGSDDYDAIRVRWEVLVQRVPVLVP